MVVLTEGASWGWNSTVTLVTLTATVVAGIALVLVELRVQYPLLDLRLFSVWNRAAGYVALGLIAISDLSLALLLSLYYQQGVGLSPLRAGFYLLPLSIAAIIGGPIAGRLTNRVSARVLSSLGATVHAVGLVGLATSIAMDLPVVVTLLCLGLTGFGTSLFTTPNTYAIMISLPATHGDVGNALRSSIQNAAGVAGTAVVVSWTSTQPVPIDSGKASPFNYVTLLVLLAFVCAVAATISLTRGASRIKPE